MPPPFVWFQFGFTYIVPESFQRAFLTILSLGAIYLIYFKRFTQISDAFSQENFTSNEYGLAECPGEGVLIVLVL